MEPRQEDLAEFRVGLGSALGVWSVADDSIQMTSITLQGFEDARPYTPPRGREMRGENLIRIWWGGRYVQDFGEYRLIYDAEGKPLP